MLVVITIYIILLSFFAYFIWKLHHSGLFDTVEVCISASPPVLNRSVTLYYKHHIGPYNRLSTVYQETKNLVPGGGVMFAIYYDDPEELKEHLLQSAVGVIFGEEGKDYYSEEYSERLTKWGYERMILPKIERAVVATQKFDGQFSLFTLINFTHPKVNTFVKRQNLPVRVAMEIYSNRQIHVLIPLDHLDDFIIPQLMTIEEVESKLIGKEGYSDSNSESTSESELIDEQDEHEIDGAAEIENNENKKNE